MIYPTVRAVVLAAMGAPLALALALGGGRLWLFGPAWLAAVLAATFADSLLAADRRTLAVVLTAPSGLALGRLGQGDISVAFGARPPLMLELAVETDDRVSLLPRWSRIPIANAHATALFDLEPLRRGQARLPRIWARWKGPLGLVFKQRVDLCQAELNIALDIQSIKEDAARLISANPMFGARLQHRLGGGSEFHALSDYRPGMDRRMIDWKQSARHRRLLVKEFETERNAHIVFAIDCGRQMCEPVAGLPRIDRVLQAALLLGFGALKAGDRVGLFAFDERPRQWTGVLAGPGAFPQLQRLAAGVDYSTAETNYTLGLTQLGANLQRRSLVVMFTEFTDATTAELMLDHVGRVLKTHLVLFVVLQDEELDALERAPIVEPADVSRAVIAGALARERELVIARLRRMGVEVLQAPVLGLGPALLARYIDLKQRSLV